MPDQVHRKVHVLRVIDSRERGRKVSTGASAAGSRLGQENCIAFFTKFLVFFGSAQ